MKRALLAIAASGCLAQPTPGQGVLGSPDDFETGPGDYVGYRVVTDCTGPGLGPIVVVGTGATELIETSAIHAAGNELYRLLAELPSVWGSSGTALVCPSMIGAGIQLSDWREVDRALAITGAWLRERDLALAVGVEIAEIPRPVASGR